MKKETCVLFVVVIVVLQSTDADYNPKAQNNVPASQENHNLPDYSSQSNTVNPYASNAPAITGEKLEVIVRSVSGGDVLTHSGNSSVQAAELFGRLLVLADDNVLLLHEHEQYELSLEFQQIVPALEDFLDVTSIEWSGETYLAARFADGRVEVWSGASVRKLRRRQGVRAGGRPVRALFTIVDDHLHLIVLYAGRKGETFHCMIYEWKSSHFDEINSLPTKGGTDLAIIPEKGGFYIIIAENSAMDGAVSIHVFSRTSGVRRVHRVTLRAAATVLAYEERGDEPDHYVLALTSSGEGVILKKSDGEFLLQARISGVPKSFTSMVGYMQGVPVIFLGHENTITLYRPTPNGLEDIKALSIVRGFIVHRLLLAESRDKRDQVQRLVVISRARSNILITAIDLVAKKHGYARPPPASTLLRSVARVAQMLEERRRALERLAQTVKSLETMSGVLYDDTLRIDHPIKLTRSKIGTFALDSASPVDVDLEELVAMQDAAEKNATELEAKLTGVAYGDQPIVVTEPVTIHNELKVDSLEAEQLASKSVNDDEFDPATFLGEADEQRFLTPEMNTLRVINLTAPDIFLNVLGGKSPTVKSLRAQNLFVPAGETINGMQLEELVLDRTEEMVRGKKTFDEFVVRNVDTKRMAEISISDMLSRSTADAEVKQLRTSGVVSVNELFVKSVNGRDIMEVMDRAYLKDKGQVIKGNLIFTSGLNVERLFTSTFQNISVSNMMTRSTEQVITSRGLLNNVVVNNLRVDSLNGLDVEKDIVMMDRNQIVLAPVSIANIEVRDRLRLNCGPESGFCGVLDLSQEDLLQVYQAPVHIHGNVIVNKLKFAGDAALFVRGERFHTDVEHIFWMKSKYQRIPDGITFSAGLTVPHLTTRALQGLGIERYLRIDSELAGANVRLADARIAGDVTFDPRTACGATMQELVRDVVSKTGDFQITGRKYFHDTAVVRDLEVAAINEYDMSDVVLLHDAREKAFTGDVTVKKVRVRGNLLTNCDVESSNINGVNLQHIQEKAIKIDENATLKELAFKKEVYVPYIEAKTGTLVKELKNLNYVLSNVSIHLKGDLYAQGGLQHVDTLNGLHFDSFIGQVVDRTVGGEVGGKKVFEGGVIVSGNFHAKVVNGLDLSDKVHHALSRTADQTVVGRHTVNHAYIERLVVSTINGLDMYKLVDKSQSTITLNGTVSLEKARVLGTLTGASTFDIARWERTLRAPDPRCWRRVQLEGDVKWLRGGAITSIAQKAVRNNTDNYITGSVTFGGLVDIYNSTSDEPIEGIDIKNIYDDAVRKSLPYQTITGNTTFAEDIEVKKLTAAVDLYVGTVDGYDIGAMNHSLARKYKENVFEGPITFPSEVNASSVTVQGKLIGIPPLTDIVTTSTTSREITRAEAWRLEVLGDVKVETINELPFNDFLSGLVYIEGEEQHIYGDVSFQAINVDEASIEVINSVPAEELVFDEEEVSQLTVPAPLVFDAPLVVDGNAVVDTLNGVDLKTTLTNVIWSYDDLQFDGDVKTDECPVFMSGVEGDVNGVDIKKSLKTLIGRVEYDVEYMRSMVANVSNYITAATESVEGIPPRVLYVEWSATLNASLKSLGRAYATGERSLTIVTSERSARCSSDYGLQCNCGCETLVTIDVENEYTKTEEIVANSRLFYVQRGDQPPIAHVVSPYLQDDKKCNAGSEDTSTKLIWVYDKESYAPSATSGLVEGVVADVCWISVEGAELLVVAVEQHRKPIEAPTYSVIFNMNVVGRIVSPIQMIEMRAVSGVHGFVCSSGAYLIFASSSYEQQPYVYKYFKETGQFAAIEITGEGKADSVQAVTSVPAREHALMASGNTLRIYQPRDGSFQLVQVLEHGANVLQMVVLESKSAASSDNLLFVSTADGSITLHAFTHYQGWVQKWTRALGLEVGMPHTVARLPASTRAWDTLVILGSNATALLSPVVLGEP